MELDSYLHNDLLSGAGNSSQRREYQYTDKKVSNGLTYWYKLVDVDYSGVRKEHPAISATPNAFDTENRSMPDCYALHHNYPNPFNPTTTFKYALPKESTIILSIYDINGRLIETLANEKQQPGFYSIQWDASQFSSGVYIYRIQAGGFSSVKKCILMK